ncbi:MAG: hypothetical protein WEC14_09160 [Chloroflexota bacterium]
MDITIPALVFAAISTGVIVFQFALAGGAPWGEYAMGGAFPGVYPPRMRVAAIAQAVVIAGIALIVLSAAGVVAPDLASSLPWLIWVIVVVTGVGIVLNAISPSAGERRVWVPVTIALFICSLLVAVGA